MQVHLAQACMACMHAWVPALRGSMASPMLDMKEEEHERQEENEQEDEQAADCGVEDATWGDEWPGDDAGWTMSSSMRKEK